MSDETPKTTAVKFDEFTHKKLRIVAAERNCTIPELIHAALATWWPTQDDATKLGELYNNTKNTVSQ